MIFVTIGTHDQQFTRLIKRIDEIAPEINEKIIIQRGFTNYVPKNCESFRWAAGLDDYYKKARLVISHGGSSVWEFVYSYKKPLIVVPRQHKFNEHFNEHQVEFARSFEKRTGAKVIYNINELTPQLLKSWKKVIKVDKNNLKRLQNFMKKVIEEVKDEQKK